MADNEGSYDFSNGYIRHDLTQSGRMSCSGPNLSQIPRAAKAPGNYYDNSNLCGECTGAGCVRCNDQRGLLEIGTVRFPLSSAVSDCKPPAILHLYGKKFSRYPRHTTKRHLRTW